MYICPNCNGGNTQDAKFSSMCKMIMSFEGYQQAQESDKQKDIEIETLKQRDKMTTDTMAAMLDRLDNVTKRLKELEDANKK